MSASRFAILIGADSHKHSRAWSPLSYVRGDIGGPDGLAHVLKHDLGPSCNFDGENVTELMGADATSDAAESALSTICKAAGKDDLVLIYFSGHGIVHDDGDQPVLVTYETEPAKPHKTGLTFAFIEGLARTTRAQLLLIIDACFSGRLLSTTSQLRNSEQTTADPAEDAATVARKARERFGRLDGLAVFASCQSEQVSKPGPTQAQSLFTHHFVAALRGTGTALAGGRVTTNSLGTYLEEVFQRETQRPAILTPPKPIVLSVPERPLGEYVRVATDPWAEYLQAFSGSVSICL